MQAPGNLPTSLGPREFILGVCTLGTYWIYCFYVTGRTYERLAGTPSKVRALFWTYWKSALVLSFLTVATEGALLLIQQAVQIVLGYRLLNEMLSRRDEGVRKHWGALSRLTPKSGHLALWVTGPLTTWLGIGFFLLLLQTYLYFRDYNRIVRALRSNAGFPGTSSASSSSASPSP